MKLNKKQKEAVEHGNGPILIIAGAGTGKTTVIVERIKYLIAKGFADPSEILALTFTEKASREMEERVDVAMPYGYTQMWIMTFHSFCDQVLRDDGVQAGFDSRFNLMTQSESIQFLRDNFDSLKLEYFAPLGNPYKHVLDLLTHFSRLADEDIDPSEYFAWANEKLKTKNEKLDEEEALELEKWKELSRAYEVYDKLKKESSVMDFSDLIANTLALFRRRKNVLKEYRERFKYILVDEYQDTNFAQNELVKLLAGKHGNITVVADDDQSIYKWRGAAVSNVVQFRKSFPKTKVVTLTENYRSNQTILDGAYQLIQHNNPARLEIVEGIDKKLIGKKKGGRDSINFIHKRNLAEETDEVVQQVKKLVGKNYNYQYADIAILVRANNHARAFENALDRSGIPNMFLGPGKLFERKEVVDLVSYLKFLSDPDDSMSLYRLLTSEFLEVNSYDLLRLSNKAKKKNVKLYSMLAPDNLKNEKLSDSVEKRILEIRKLLEKSFANINRKSAIELVYEFMTDTGYYQKLVDAKTENALEKVQNISKFFEKLKNYESSHKDTSIFAVTDWIDLSRDLGESPIAGDEDWTQSDSVKILTIHSAKGLEFPVVFLVNLVNQRFPSRNRRDGIPIPDELIKEQLPGGDSHTQEERRLFYVGLTRAKDRVYLLASDFYGEEKRKTKISQFVNETLGDAVTSDKQLGVGNKEPSSNFVFTDNKSKSSVPVGKYKVDYLSYTRINTFKNCSLHYKLNFILNIPTPKTEPLSFGSSIHQTLDEYYREIMKGNKVTSGKLGKIFDSNWINEGYKTKIQESRAYKRGERYISEYFNLHKSMPVATYSTEQKLKAFIVREGERLKISGNLDRVDVINGKIEIVDYKTSEKVPTQKEIDKNEQLSFYALLVSKTATKPFNIDLSDVTFSLYYFKEQKKLSTKRTAEQIVNYEDEVFKIKEGIENSDFKCSGSFICKDCEYKLFCKA